VKTGKIGKRKWAAPKPKVDAPPAPQETEHDRDPKNLTHAWSIACESARRRNLSAAPDVTHTQLIGDRAEHQEHT
jgi:hypothetical protein